MLLNQWTYDKINNKEGIEFKIFGMYTNKIEKCLKCLLNHVFIVEGLIAVGKTTLVNSLEEYIKRSSYRSLQVNVFVEIINKNLLKLFKEEERSKLHVKNQYAFTLQMAQHYSRRCILQKAYENSGNAITFIDRGLVGDYIFALTQKQLDNINEEEWEAYIETYKEYKYVKEPSLHIYLKVSPKVAWQRYLNRNGGKSDGYTLEYFEKLSNNHDTILEQQVNNLITIDYSENIQLEKKSNGKSDNELLLLPDEMCKKILTKIIASFIPTFKQTNN